MRVVAVVVVAVVAVVVVVEVVVVVGEMVELLESLAGFLPGNGDVCELAARRIRALLAKIGKGGAA